ncbi:hypothetical protein [Sphingobacterium faecale]|uniref:DUF4595 domain-containing protein n=1 Tax=Sphingobacterium faecale TaxID=2803775 RepID=A0ABS1R8Q0_9SPHI|nr:hypothetical protein [Sphingobacterium faecale]MBL1411053.1 hypothetical protein [Sphingobacterium faecale]
MKQIKLFLTLILIGAMTVSCEKDDDDSTNTDAILVTKIITTDVEGKKTSSLYEYDGTKIKKITETSDLGTTVFNYTYTGNEITKIAESNEDGIVKSQSFIYVDGKLRMWAENYETDSETCFACEITATVEYNTDGSQTVKYREGEVLKKQVEIKYNALDNSITQLDLDGTGDFITLEIGKANPHKNIIGWNKLLRIDPYVYAEENVNGYMKYINDEHVSGGHIKYKYNSNNFPTSCTSDLYDKEYFYNK